MIRSIHQLYGNKLGASDGDIGQVKDFYFNDLTWAVRYVVADTGNWLANVGVHGKSVELHLERLWSSNITLATRLVDAHTTPRLLKRLSRDALTQKDWSATDSIYPKS
jgi:hypothetical protein